MTRSWAHIDLQAVAANVELATKAADGAEVCAVIKADGYGHGAAAVGAAAIEAGATRLAVAQVGEGVALRRAGLTVPIWVLAEPGRWEFETAAAERLEPAVYSTAAIAAAERAASLANTGAALPVHLKVDTGMHRSGAAVGDIVTLAQSVLAAEHLELGSVWTHLACADTDPAQGPSSTADQLDRYEATLGELARAGISVPLRHAANSAGCLGHPRAAFDVVRCGIALYGLAPSPELGRRHDLRPALSWHTTVGFVKRIGAGSAVGYGGREQVPADTTVATIPVGYADGYRRALWRDGAVLIGGRRRRILGVVSMDQTVVDCGDDEVECGDEVVLIGRQGDEEITADELAELLGTINYEIATGIGARVARRYGQNSGPDGRA